MEWFKERIALLVALIGFITATVTGIAYVSVQFHRVELTNIAFEAFQARATAQLVEHSKRIVALEKEVSILLRDADFLTNIVLDHNNNRPHIPRWKYATPPPSGPQ